MDVLGSIGRALELAGKAQGAVSQLFADKDLLARIDRLPTRLGPYGVDPFGFDPQYVKRYIAYAVAVYRYYFRCVAYGVSNIPAGRCFIVANHSGQLPFDAAMITLAAFLEREPPRFLRSMIERFVPTTPFVSPFLQRCGQILGTPENCKRLLEADEAILVFPEGVGGLNKPWRERYRLQRFGQGFMRLAIETQAAIVPCAVVGAEEQAPVLFNARGLGELFGLPSLPITATFPGFGLLPWPTKYRIYFGEPMTFEGDPNDEDEVVFRKVDQVKNATQRLIDAGLKARRSVFF